jgi:hypothetical protein
MSRPIGILNHSRGLKVGQLTNSRRVTSNLAPARRVRQLSRFGSTTRGLGRHQRWWLRQKADVGHASLAAAARCVSGDGRRRRRLLPTLGRVTASTESIADFPGPDERLAATALSQRTHEQPGQRQDRAPAPQET